MGKIAANKTWVFMDQYSIASSLSSVELNTTVETPVVTGLSDSGPRRVEGNYDTDHSFNGFFDGAQYAFDEQVYSWLLDNVAFPSGHKLGVIFGTALTPQGYPAYEYRSRLSGAPWSAANGAATLLNFSGAGDDAILRGKCICHDPLVTAPVAETGYNLGVTGATDYFGVVMRALYGSVWGGGTCTVTVLQSDDDAVGDPYTAIDGAFHWHFSADGRVTLIYKGVTKAWKQISVSGQTATNTILQVTAGTFKGVPNLAAANISLP